jgi:DNA-binding MarR family transcriptional regulator
MNVSTSKDAARSLDSLNPLLQHRSRLGAMVLLSTVDALSFTNLRDTLSETDGNLAAQLRKLEEANYLSVRKEFNRRKPISWYSITPPGRAALKNHLVALESLIKAAKV